MFSNAKVGDKVWDFVLGWGEITHINRDTQYGIVVNFPAHSGKYTVDGKIWTTDPNSRLFWDEIIFKVPNKPMPDLPHLAIDTKVVVWNGSGVKRKCYFRSFADDGRIRVWGNGSTSFSATSQEHYDTWPNWELYEEE